MTPKASVAERDTVTVLSVENWFPLSRLMPPFAGAVVSGINKLVLLTFSVPLAAKV